MDEVSEITKKITSDKSDLNQISRAEALEKLLELGKKDNCMKSHRCEACDG